MYNQRENQNNEEGRERKEGARTHTHTRARQRVRAREESFIPASKKSRKIMCPSNREKEINKAPAAPFMCPSSPIESVSHVTFISSPSFNSVHILVIINIENIKREHASCTRAHTDI